MFVWHFCLIMSNCFGKQIICYTNVDVCRFPMSSLSKFANCLSDQQLHLSPLMGHITSIVDQKLSSIDDPRSVIQQI